MMRHIKILINLSTLIAFLVIAVTVWANSFNVFVEVNIDPLFHNILTNDSEFMKQGGARFIAEQDGRMALIGIGKIFPEGFKTELMPESRRKGEIRARTAILELGEDIEISTSRALEEKSLGVRHSAKRISLSSFFQTTETRIQGIIQQMPIIGTWWSKNYSTFFVAVGKMANVESEGSMLFKLPKSESAFGKMKILEGEEPFLSLLNASPILCQNGGVKGFVLDDNRKVLISANSTTIKSSLTKARKIARLKAIRSLLAQQEGIQISSVESLADKEHLVLSRGKEQHLMLSQFLSIQEEQVSGTIKAMPIVAVWKDPTEQILYIAVGHIF